MQLITAVTIAILCYSTIVIVGAKKKAAPPPFQCYSCTNCNKVDPAKTIKETCKCEPDPKDKTKKKQICPTACLVDIDAKTGAVFRRCPNLKEKITGFNTCIGTLCNNGTIPKVKCFKCDNCANVTANTTKIECSQQCMKALDAKTKKANYGCAKSVKCPIIKDRAVQCCKKDNCNSFGPLYVKPKNVTKPTTKAPKANVTVPTTAKPTKKAKATSYANNVEPFTFLSLAAVSLLLVKVLHFD